MIFPDIKFKLVCFKISKTIYREQIKVNWFYSYVTDLVPNWLIKKELLNILSNIFLSKFDH